jgi:TolB protein
MAVWSPDGAYIAYVCYKDGPIFQDPVEVYFDTDAAEICIMDADGSNKRRLTHNQVFDWYPIWSPDGKSIAFVSFDGLYVIDMKRGETRQLFEDRLGIMLNPEWSPDGLRVVFSTCRPGDESGSDIFIVDGMGNEIIKLDNPTNATLERFPI